MFRALCSTLIVYTHIDLTLLTTCYYCMIWSKLIHEVHYNVVYSIFADDLRFATVYTRKGNVVHS